MRLATLVIYSTYVCASKLNQRQFRKKSKASSTPKYKQHKIAINTTFCNFGANMQPLTNRRALAWKKLSPACGTTCVKRSTFKIEKIFLLVYLFSRSFYLPKGKSRFFYCNANTGRVLNQFDYLLYFICVLLFSKI